MKLPAPVVVGKGKKMYYTLGLKSNEKISKNITNFITDKWDEIKKAKVDFDKEQLEKRKSSAHIAIILSAEVDIFDITLADIIKPKDEWTLLGVIDHKEGLIKAAPSQQVPYELIPKDLFNGCQCDHCNKPTRRNKSVFIQNNDTHKIMRVGGTCIKYYLGIDYEKVLDYVSELSLFVNEYYGNGDANFGDFDWEGGGRGGRMEIFVDVKDTAKYFLAIAKKHGYMSKSGAEKINATKTGDEKMVQTTKDKVENVLDFVFKPFDSREYGKNTSYMRDLYEKQLAEVTETIEKESDDSYNEFVKFVDDNYKENNFLVNVKNMVDAGSYKVNHMGYVLSACSMYYGKKYYEELKKKSEEERNAKNSVEKAESNWVGVVGEKSNFENLTIVHISGYQGQWGWTSQGEDAVRGLRPRGVWS